MLKQETGTNTNFSVKGTHKQPKDVLSHYERYTGMIEHESDEAWLFKLLT